MSGQLVGEVIDAAESGHLGGLSRPAFHALIAIAEKCHQTTRQGTVRRDRIRAAIYAGNSSRTAERAIRELREAGLVRVVKRGFKAPNGDSKASIYEIAALVDNSKLPPSKVAEARPEAPAKSDEAPAKSAQAPATQGGGIDGSIDGSIDGGAPASAATPIPPPTHPGEEPERYCKAHMPNGTTRACHPCGAAKRVHAQWHTDKTNYQRAYRRWLIDNCDYCDRNGKREAGDDLLETCDHPNSPPAERQAR